MKCFRLISNPSLAGFGGQEQSSGADFSMFGVWVVSRVPISIGFACSCARAPPTGFGCDAYLHRQSEAVTREIGHHSRLAVLMSCMPTGWLGGGVGGASKSRCGNGARAGM